RALRGALPDPRMAWPHHRHRLPDGALARQSRAGLPVHAQPHLPAGHAARDVPHRIPGGLTMSTLGELARLIRSKNAGPFTLTFVVMFDTQEAYRRVKQAHVLNRKTVAELYSI